MSASLYHEISVATGVTSNPFTIDFTHSSLSAQVSAVGTARLEVSCFNDEDIWEPWLYGDITGVKSVEIASSVRRVRLVSVTGAASVAISGRK